MEKGLLLSAFRVLVLASCFLQVSRSAAAAAAAAADGDGTILPSLPSTGTFGKLMAHDPCIKVAAAEKCQFTIKNLQRNSDCAGNGQPGFVYSTSICKCVNPQIPVEQACLSKAALGRLYDRVRHVKTDRARTGTDPLPLW